MTAHSPDLNTEDADTHDIDFAWDADASCMRPVPRDLMPTLPEADPLRYDVQYDYKCDPARDSLPTLPDTDPLRHDWAGELS